MYLSIGIGGTQFQEIYGVTQEAVDKMELFANDFKKTFNKYKPHSSSAKVELLEDHLDFEKPLTGSSRNLNLLFEKGTIFAKEYDLKNLSDVELDDDLIKYINVYNNIANDPKSENFDIAAESLMDDEISNEESNKDKIEFDYDVKEFEPKEKIQKPLKKSTIFKAKKKKKTQESKKLEKRVKIMFMNMSTEN